MVRELEIIKASYENYRNLNKLTVEPNKATNILIGDNAQGKTNFLEGIYFSATGRSLRHSPDTQLINFNENHCHLQLFTKGNYATSRIDVHLKRDTKKGVAINGVTAKKLSDLLGTLYVVCFSPEDLGLIKDSPARRRRFLDMELCQTDKIYYYNLQQYYQILKQRNHLLKDIKRKPNLKSTLELWTEQLDNYGKPIILARENFINKLNEVGSHKMSKLTGGKDNLEIIYKPNTDYHSLRNKLENNIERDILMGNTQFGPHKDDINFIINGVDGKQFGSQGQQRSTALAIKLAEIDIIYEETGEKPVLLLDDVFSELDKQRQNFLVESISGLQSFITCTGVEDALRGLCESGTVYRVIDGEIVIDKNLNIDENLN